jgi:hypothetical protein
VFVGKRHLDDTALIRRYMADRGLAALEADDEALLRHLVQCASCEARYVGLQRTLDDVRDSASEDADARCTPDLLSAQRDRILRRVDAQYHGPRVIAFPTAGTAGKPVIVHSTMIRRWVAAAAVAGLVIGLTAGRLLQFAPLVRDVRRQPAVASPAQVPARAVPVMTSLHPDPADDGDELLSEVDQATAAPQAAELRAIYAFTLEASRPPMVVRAVKR